MKQQRVVLFCLSWCDPVFPLGGGDELLGSMSEGEALGARGKC